MIHMPLPSHFASGRNPPPRTDSLKANKATKLFSDIDDELRDTRRVHSQGQEEDLRYALNRTINRVEELTSILKEAYKVQTDLQTELTLAKSNLQMALANNEMLEDALKRDPGTSKEVGWRRMSAREQNLKAEADADRRRSTDSLASTEYSASPTMSHPSPAMDHSPIAPRSATMPSPAPSASGESRFFRFRFGNGSSNAVASHPSSPRMSAAQPLAVNGSHLTSASLPSLVPPRDYEKEVEELQKRLEAEKKAHKDACDAKVALEGELESLSQALFEEANKMVATERMRLAETEEQLREAREQGEALKNVLRLFERDSAAGKRSSVVGPLRDSPTPEPDLRRSRHRASSSAVGIRAPSSGRPSSDSSRPSSPAPVRAASPPLASAKTITPDTEPYTPPERVSSREGLGPHSAPAAPPHEVGAATAPHYEAATAAAPHEPAGFAPAPGPNLHVTTPPTSSSTPSASPAPSPSPSPLSGGQFLFAPQRAVNYFDGEESPWADAPSSSPRVSS